MKKYIKPEVNIVRFDLADIIRLSVTGASDDEDPQVTPDLTPKVEDETAGVDGEKDTENKDPAVNDDKGTDSDDTGTETPLAPVETDPSTSPEGNSQPEETPPAPENQEATTSPGSGENQEPSYDSNESPSDSNELPVEPIPDQPLDPVQEPASQEPPTASDDIAPMAETGYDTVE